ncbi:MAG TPA: phage major capsid protein [Allosphingosinicella sp.]|jgi:HK97 family phage major capsid protein
MNILEIRQKAQRLAHEARDLLNTITDDGSNEAEVTSQFDTMIAEHDRLEARAKRMEEAEERAKAFEAADTLIPGDTRSVEGNREKASDAFVDYLRGNIDDRELRAQAVGTNAAGGFTVPTTLSNNLILALKGYGPMNEGGGASWLITAEGNLINIPTLDDTSNKGALLAENTDAADADLTFGQKSLPVYKYTSGTFKVSNELLMDSGVDVARIVTDAMAERLGRAINEHCTVGTGSAQPQGIVTGASAGITAASATAIAADELIDLIHSVDMAYRPRGTFMFNDGTLKVLRKLKNSDGDYIWRPGMDASAPGTLFGYAYAVNNDMATIAASAKSVLFGDMAKYQGRRAGGFALRRLDERFATSDQVGFVGFARIGGVVVDSRALKVLTQAAS